MSETKFTPKEFDPTGTPFTSGPWLPMLDGPDNTRDPWTPWQAGMEAAPGLTIASPVNTEPICRVSGYLQPVVANAHLIAAAPELYAALLALVHTCDDAFESSKEAASWARTGDIQGYLNTACAALARARGEQPKGDE